MSHPDPAPLDPLRIALLAGGSSAEREVSLLSGAAVARSLAASGHTVSRIDPAGVDLQALDWSAYDVAFLALHGPFGEDGRVQQILEEAGVPYTGSDSASSRLAFSKSAAKERFVQLGVPTPAYVLIHESDSASRIEQLTQVIGFPLVIKPDAQGSSLGVTIVHTPDQLPHALAQCFHYDSFGVMEAAVLGSEWTLGVIDDLVLPLIQVETDREFYDYDAKYKDDDTRYLFDFTLPQTLVDEIGRVGRQACEALRTRGIARVDLRLDRVGRPWVLEVNTIPGFTDHSLVPKAAARIGIDFNELCAMALRSCLRPATRRVRG